MKLDLNYYPGWVRKSITFTIDDGNTKLDRKFMNYIKPAGIKGTFNLRTPLNRETPEGYRALYKGYEINNHNRYHANAFADGVEYKMVDEIFDSSKSDNDRSCVYKTPEEGIYRNYTYAWTYIADDDRYIECVRSAQAELEQVFGKGNVRGYVWPNGEQKNAKVFERMTKEGFYGLRKTGNVKGSTGFALPADRNRWSYNANNMCMDEVSAEYEALPDDGNLKFFCFGVHSHDFENAGNWDVLQRFCDKFGNRPEDFWYASVGEIFDYEDAVKAVKTEEEVDCVKVYNPSSVDLYIKADGRRYVLGAGETLEFGK